MEIFKNILYKHAGKSAKTTMHGINETEVGPPPEYGGDPTSLNPEEMLVASVNSCIMLVFFHFAKKYEIDVTSYQSNAEGKVEKTKNGLRFTNVEVRAKVSVAGDIPSERIEEIARLADKYCLVSGSLACPVHFNVEVVDKAD